MYPERAVNAVVNGIKASEINVGYIGQCFGMDRNQYNQFIRYIQRDAAGAAEDSILLAKGYAIACYYRERYEVLDDIPVKKPGVADKGLTFDLFEDLVKIAIWHREELLDKFMTRRKRPKRVSK